MNNQSKMLKMKKLKNLLLISLYQIIHGMIFLLDPKKTIKLEMSGMNIHKNYPKKVKEIVGMMKLSQHKKINQKTDLMMKIMNIAI